MTLASSGTISIGGSTASRSINLELGRSATATSSLGETSLRTLAGVSSGAISLSNFHGKAHILDTQTVTVGAYNNIAYGWDNYSFFIGAISDGTCNFKNGANIRRVTWYAFNPSKLMFIVSGQHDNNEFTTMSISGQNFSRTDASYTAGSNVTSWEWTGVANPFGTTVGTTKTVTWT